jgi:mRNA-degrading endonuclease RelE of RelBE toxin-antitoxin system
MNLRVSSEVRDFMRTLAPEQRRLVSRTLRAIESGKARMEALQEPLEPFYKVKAGTFRILCAVQGNTVCALVVERRAVVYDIATAQFLEQLLKATRR